MKGRAHSWSNVTFTIHDTEPEEDECRRLIARVLGQAVLDYVNFKNQLTRVSEEDFITAELMLFNAEYLIQWGDNALSTRELCACIDIELDWFRDRIERKIEETKK